MPAPTEADVDRLLDRDPGNIEGLVAKADLRTAAGDDRAAASFYNAALSAAAAMGGPLPMSLKPVIERAQAGIRRAEGLFERHLQRYLAEAGFPEDHRPARFAESIDMLLGRKPSSLRLQRPTSYYFPGLPERRYYERAQFGWAHALEREVPRIRAELARYLDTGADGFTPYLVDDPARPRRDFHGLANNPAWSTLYIWENGGPVAGLADRFPDTLSLIRRLDLPHIGRRAPSILFSRLGAGARIPAHSGVTNARLICHLPLIVPPGCGFRVGGETRAWREGELLVFDDSVEHEAWNDSSEDRILLIFDIWRPELDGAERRAVTALFEAIDHYRG